MYTGSVTNFFAKEAERELQTKITFLVSALLVVICLTFIAVVSIPKSELNSSVHGDTIVKPFSKSPPAIKDSATLNPYLAEKNEMNKKELVRLKKLYRSLAAKKLKEKNMLKKLKILRKSISRQQLRVKSLETRVNHTR